MSPPEKETNPLSMGLLFFACIIAFFFAGKIFGNGGSKLVGQSAPTIDLPLLTSEASFSTNAHHGKPILIDFWASWCGPCRMQAPIVDHVAEMFEKDGLVVIGVNTSDAEGDARAYLKNHKFSYPIAFDGDRSVASSYGVTSFPTMVLIDKDGKVKAVRSGVTSADTLASLVRDVL